MALWDRVYTNVLAALTLAVILIAFYSRSWRR